ncbi:MAG: TGS domain-containing protein [Nanoarchaeota archaeon]
MISLCPAHKGAENLRAQLKTRLKKFQRQLEKSKKSGKSSKIGIKKEDMQIVLVGGKNSGKSSLLKILTNAKVQSSPNKITSKPIVGMMNYNSIQMQLIEIPPIDSELYDKGIVYTADVILILINKLSELKIEKEIKTKGKRIIVFNKIDLCSNKERRKISATLQSKKYNFQLISTKTKNGIEELKNKIFSFFDKIRIFTKEPGKEINRNRPMILELNSNVKDVAEKILKGFSKNIKQTKIWGPSSKFPGQVVGLKHKLKDLDIVEFKTK